MGVSFVVGTGKDRDSEHGDEWGSSEVKGPRSLVRKFKGRDDGYQMRTRKGVGDGVSSVRRPLRTYL